MEKRKDEQKNEAEEIKHSNVQDSIDQYFLDKINEGKKPLNIDEVVAKMQMHVDIQRVKDEQEKEKKRAKDKDDREL